MIRIDLPIDEKTIRHLRVGDEVSLHGMLVTARDAAHKLMVQKWPTFVDSLVRDGAIYHCGPVVQTVRGKHKTVSAGPTTSSREEPYEADIIDHYGARIIIGKGGMGARTLAAMKRHGAVYVHATGGAATVIANSIVRTPRVHMLKELGGPEAFWEFEVDGFEGVVTMDSTGGSLHNIVREKSKKKLRQLIGR